MKNFLITAVEDGKKYWISRSIAIVAFIITRDSDGDLCVLANKRGIGTPDFQGYWNCPCGYLDYDETLAEAASREVREETGYIIPPHELSISYINSDPKENRQNVTVRFEAFVKNPILSERSGGEVNEVEEVKWIKLSDINKYQWAFSHDKIISTISTTK